MENWRIIPGTDGRYEVSDLGRIRHILAGGHARLMRPWTSQKGYLRIDIVRDGKYRKPFVHRLVIEAFCGPIEQDMQVNHIDGDKQNNRLANLEVTTAAGNREHAVSNGLIRPGHGIILPVFGKGNGQSKLDRATVEQMRMHYAAGRFNFTEMARIYGVDKTTVRRAVRGITWA